jgi:hypothetical protein
MKPTFQHLPAADEEDDPKYCPSVLIISPLVVSGVGGHMRNKWI